MYAATSSLVGLIGRKWLLLAAVSLIAACQSLGGVAAYGAAEPPFRQRVRVPPLPEGLTWLNTAGPMDLKSLRGKFVLLDFWTYCCINCMHILPELEKLEKAYPNNLVVIGVHSAKFETEQSAENIREAILRHNIRHPVVNDAEHVLWNRFGVRAWPTLLLIDPEGYAVWGTSGESTFEVIDRILAEASPYYRSNKLLDETPLRFDLAAYSAPRTPLRFPGKVLADEQGDRLFIADSGHNRIVITRLDGSLIDTVGTGAVGTADGDFSTAQFNDPQGMALRSELLYVADTGNHMIRAVDLAERTVATVAGTGVQNRERPRFMTVDAAKQALNSPWALWIHDEALYIAMAGPHQIWKMSLEDSRIGPYAGNGREDIVDGPLLPRTPYQTGYASFAQPSGLASDGVWLYVADSEGSSIRAVPLDPRQEVRTVVGTADLPGARLFTFGDVDGARSEVRLQHPLGVVYFDGQLYVADTYNNKIKKVDPKKGTTRTLTGTGRPGRGDDPAEFDEPAGITAAVGKLFVADTNNHLVRVVDLNDGAKVRTLEIPGLEPPKPRAESGDRLRFTRAVEQPVDPVTIRPEAGGIRLRVKLELPPGHKLNPLAPMAYGVESSETGLVRSDCVGRLTRIEKPAGEFQIKLPLARQSGPDTLRVGLNYYYCREGSEGLCKVGSVVWIVPVTVAADAGTSTIALDHRVP
jgi:thiol-disulfide isomerase/thioredoxin